MASQTMEGGELRPPQVFPRVYLWVTFVDPHPYPALDLLSLVPNLGSEDAWKFVVKIK